MLALKYWIWLSAADVSARAKAELLLHYGDAEKIYMAPKGDFEKLNISASEREKLEKRDMTMVDAVLEKCEMQNLEILTFQDSRYPERLRNIYAPPAVLYVRGRLPVVDENVLISVVGTRNATPYGIKMAKNIAGEIARCGGIVVSGLTRGIDAAAAEGALYAGGTVIGILGTSHELDRNYLSADVALRGALISEYPPMTDSRKTHFRERNRINSGISLGVVAVEAPEGSNTLLFVKEAAEQGKEIFAVPGNVGAPNSVETNGMIRDGAHIVTCGWDVMDEFKTIFPEKIRISEHYESCEENNLLKCAAGENNHPESRKSAARQKPTKKEVDKKIDRGYSDLKEQLEGLSEEQLKIITAVERSASHIDDIIEQTGLSTAKVLAQLTILEIKGFIRREAGKRIILNITKK